MRPFLVMGAYRKGAFPLQERAARFSRVVGVLYAEALYIVQRLDETVHPSVFPQISCLNSELLRLYEEGADGSDLPRSVTCILGCFRDTCFVCRSPLQPTDDMTPPLDASEVGNYGLFMNERLCPVPYILPYSCGKHWIATRKSFTRVRGLMSPRVYSPLLESGVRCRTLHVSLHQEVRHQSGRSHPHPHPHVPSHYTCMHSTQLTRRKAELCLRSAWHCNTSMTSAMSRSHGLK